jgi:hypothetical protein
VLTEEQVHRSFQRLFQGHQVTPERIEKAEVLIQRLRLESPLRHRLSEELEELRQICLTQSH